MADRGTSNSPNTRNPKRPAAKPGRLDQFADDLFTHEVSGGSEEVAEELDVTSRREAKAMRRFGGERDRDGSFPPKRRP